MSQPSSSSKVFFTNGIKLYTHIQRRQIIPTHTYSKVISVYWWGHYKVATSWIQKTYIRGVGWYNNNEIERGGDVSRYAHTACSLPYSAWCTPPVELGCMYIGKITMFLHLSLSLYSTMVLIHPTWKRKHHTHPPLGQYWANNGLGAS